MTSEFAYILPNERKSWKSISPERGDTISNSLLVMYSSEEILPVFLLSFLTEVNFSKSTFLCLNDENYMIWPCVTKVGRQIALIGVNLKSS